MRYFIDTRNNEVITQDMINAFAAPESYYEYNYNMIDGIMTEVYKTYKTKELIVFAHSYEKELTDNYRNRIIAERNNFLEKNGLTINDVHLVEYRVPYSVYCDVLREFGYMSDV